METSQSIPVQDFFRIKTPSMTVTITAEDLLIPPLSGPIPVPGNLVTIDPRPEVSIRTPPGVHAASTTTGGALVSPSYGAASTEPPSHTGEYGTPGQDVSSGRESDESMRENLALPGLLRRESSASIVFGPRRSSSKYADALYGRLGAPPPIQPLEAEVSEERTAGGITLTHDEKAETKDYTYWDKLRRSGTRTEIRRWRTYVPEGEEETAFFGRAVGVDVPIDAYGQGVYFKQEEEDLGTKEYRLPTRSYVAPAVWVRRAKGVSVCTVSPPCSIPFMVTKDDEWHCKCNFEWNGHRGTSSVPVEN